MWVLGWRAKRPFGANSLVQTTIPSWTISDSTHMYITITMNANRTRTLANSICVTIQYCTRSAVKSSNFTKNLLRFTILIQNADSFTAKNKWFYAKNGVGFRAKLQQKSPNNKSKCRCSIGHVIAYKWNPILMNYRLHNI